MMISSVVLAACLGALASGADRGQLHNPTLLGEIIHSLFPGKPRDVSFVEYFQSFTELNENLTKALEKLDFGILDHEGLENAITLAEDARRLAELPQRSARRQWGTTTYRPADIFNYQNHSYAWGLEQRNKLFQFMQHSVYATRYEINKLRLIRLRYRNSTVYQIGVYIGNNLELKVTAGALFSTIEHMPLNVSMLWYVFNYHKLLNIHSDMASNTEWAFLLQERLNDALTHHKYAMGQVEHVSPLPTDSIEATSEDPENLYRRKYRNMQLTPRIPRFPKN